MTADAWDPLGKPITALTQAVTGAAAAGLVTLLPSHQYPLLSWGTALMAVWLCVAGLVIYVAMRRRSASQEGFVEAIGTFTLRPRGYGSRVEIIASDTVVAAIVASDVGDEIVIDPAAVGQLNRVHLGSAIGRAVEIAAAAEDEYVAALKLNASQGVTVRHGPCSSSESQAWRNPEQSPSLD